MSVTIIRKPRNLTKKELSKRWEKFFGYLGSLQCGAYEHPTITSEEQETMFAGHMKDPIIKDLWDAQFGPNAIETKFYPLLQQHRNNKHLKALFIERTKIKAATVKPFHSSD